MDDKEFIDKGMWTGTEEASPCCSSDETIIKLKVDDLGSFLGLLHGKISLFLSIFVPKAG
jgi:hypothetical protein